MKIADEIVRAYIQGKELSNYTGAWFYQSPDMRFTAPEGTETHRDLVNTVYEEIRQAVACFIPCNRPVWDALFPDWQTILEQVTMNLVVGLPQPRDAVVLRDPEGVAGVVLDLGQWVQYMHHNKLSDIVRNLLTHELCHVCIGAGISNIDDDLETPDYGTALDAMTFHEGFAHLVSYQSMEIDAVAWEDPALQETWVKSREKMQAALAETRPDVQARYRQEAVVGRRYQDKFACMCGMLYLAKCWLRRGIPGLLAEYRKGYHGFAARTLREA